MTPKTPTHDDFAMLYAGVQSRLFSFICSMVGSYDLANDVLQETNVVLWDKQHEFEIGTNFTAWSFRIARYQVMAMREKQSRDRLVFSNEMLELVAAESDSFDELYDRRQAALTFCLGHLPEKQADLIRMRYMKGRSIKWMATESSKSANAVAVQLHRIRTALADCIERRLRQSGGGNEG